MFIHLSVRRVWTCSTSWLLWIMLLWTPLYKHLLESVLSFFLFLGSGGGLLCFQFFWKHPEETLIGFSEAVCWKLHFGCIPPKKEVVCGYTALAWQFWDDEFDSQYQKTKTKTRKRNTAMELLDYTKTSFRWGGSFYWLACTILHPYQQCAKILVFPYSH